MKKLFIFFICAITLVTSVSAQRSRTTARTATDSQIDSREEENRAAPRTNTRSATRGSAPSATARTARSAASSAAPAARQARSARSATTATARTARSAASGTARSATSSARTARSASGRAARSASRQSVPARSASANTARAATTRQSRTGGGVGALSTVQKTTTQTTTTTPTDVSQALANAGLGQETQEAPKKTTEEIAAQISNARVCQTEYNRCMDDYCTDKSTDGINGRCLCSASISSLNNKETEVKKYIAGINLLNTQISQIPLAIQQSSIHGGDFMEILKEMTVKATEGTSYQLDAAGSLITSSDSDSVSEIYHVSTDNNSMKKEGQDLLDEANIACKSYLELCADSATQIQQGYGLLAGNDCRAYSKDLDDRLLKEKLTWNSRISEFSKKSLQGQLDATNAYNSQDCSTQLEACMKSDTACGADLEYCYNDALIEGYKGVCSNVLAKCQGSNENDKLWLAYKQSVLQRATNSEQLCYEKTMECVETACEQTVTTTDSEGKETEELVSKYGKCVTGAASATEEARIASFKSIAGIACGDILKKCSGSFDASGNATESQVWKIIVEEVLGNSVITQEPVPATETLNENVGQLVPQKFIAPAIRNSFTLQ